MLLIVLILLTALILISWLYHKIQLEREREQFVPIGRQVEVNAHLMNVYSEGKGDQTIVFMSGGGTCSPLLDFKSLYSELSDQYKIVVVEKAGYGFSEDSDISRSIDVILSETRQALTLAGHRGPYILAPHSMSGIEALYWTQKHPDEISAIIGLDMSVPASYEVMEISLPLMRLIRFASDVGLTRFIPGISHGEAFKHGALSEMEKDLYKDIFYRRVLTTAMYNEIREIKKNARCVSEGEAVEIPVLIFSSNGSGTGFDQESWRAFHRDFLNSISDGQMIEMDVPHYVHNYEYKQIAKEIKSFIFSLENKSSSLPGRSE